MTIEQLQLPILEEFRLFRQEYGRRTESEVPLLGEVESYLNTTSGKQLRPLLVLLSAKACGTMAEHHILLAAAVELLHNATLMHDDVVDESDERRGNDSIRHRWGNAAAVLCGDYFLAQVMTVLHDVGGEKPSTIVNETVRRMCAGELKQLSILKSGQVKLEDYLDIIGSKTAQLMSACCELGACRNTENGDETYQQIMQEFGYNYGLAFQICDDMTDQQDCHDIGFPEGVQPQQLLDQYAGRALSLLAQLPESPAREMLGQLVEITQHPKK